MATERQILKYAKERAREYGFHALRCSWRPGVEIGWPDLLIFGPNRWILGMETKSPNKDATPMQKERGRTMVMYGHAWCKPDTKDEVDFALFNFARLSVGMPQMDRAEYERYKDKLN